MITAKRYNNENKADWNGFNNSSKNPLFLFDRDYMEYHSDRFTDHSLMFYNDDKLIALLPMNERGHNLYSHEGLTYGGFITDSKMKQHTMNDCFSCLINYMKKNNYDSLLYKTIPHFYHEQPAEEDLYSLYLNNAELISIESTTVLNFANPLSMAKGRKSQISRARREGVIVEERTDDASFHQFIELENSVLSEHHNTLAVHSGEELALLHNRFPNNIHLFIAKYNNEMIAGTILFEYGQAVHTQYMAANDIARTIGGLDLIISHIIEKYRQNKLWLDFGISTENGGLILNEGLIQQKEGFGGRTNVCRRWLLKV